MAVLSDNDRARVWRAYLRLLNTLGQNVPANLKTDIRAAVDAADDWAGVVHDPTFLQTYRDGRIFGPGVSGGLRGPDANTRAWGAEITGEVKGADTSGRVYGPHSGDTEEL